MNRLETLIESLRAPSSGTTGKTALKHLGFFSCANQLDIKHVPFYEPCLILVLAGRKVLFEGQTPVACEAGAVLTVPGPSSHDLRNEPDPRTKRYRALLIPFKPEHLERLIRNYGLVHEVPSKPVGILKFAPADDLHDSITHYLTSEGNSQLFTHRLLEILLVLVTRNPALLAYALQQGGWSGRVRALLSSDLAQAWDIGQVCGQLATTESTLRRSLKREDTNFREILQDLRLTTALMQLLQTAYPINRIAYDCGYQSVSRFTSNFHKRFGMPPSQIRAAMNESEHILTG